MGPLHGKLFHSVSGQSDDVSDLDKVEGRPYFDDFEFQGVLDSLLAELAQTTIVNAPECDNDYVLRDQIYFNVDRAMTLKGVSHRAMAAGQPEACYAFLSEALACLNGSAAPMPSCSSKTNPDDLPKPLATNQPLAVLLGNLAQCSLKLGCASDALACTLAMSRLFVLRSGLGGNPPLEPKRFTPSYEKLRNKGFMRLIGALVGLSDLARASSIQSELIERSFFRDSDLQEEVVGLLLENPFEPLVIDPEVEREQPLGEVADFLNAGPAKGAGEDGSLLEAGPAGVVEASEAEQRTAGEDPSQEFVDGGAGVPRGKKGAKRGISLMKSFAAPFFQVKARIMQVVEGGAPGGASPPRSPAKIPGSPIGPSLLLPRPCTEKDVKRLCGACFDWLHPEVELRPLHSSDEEVSSPQKNKERRQTSQHGLFARKAFRSGTLIMVCKPTILGFSGDSEDDFWEKITAHAALDAAFAYQLSLCAGDRKGDAEGFGLGLERIPPCVLPGLPPRGVFSTYAAREQLQEFDEPAAKKALSVALKNISRGGRPSCALPVALFREGKNPAAEIIGGPSSSGMERVPFVLQLTRPVAAGEEITLRGTTGGAGVPSSTLSDTAEPPAVSLNVEDGRRRAK